MSTDRPPLDDMDLSAFLDQEADDGVAARLEEDPVAQSRLAQLRSVRDVVAGATVPPLGADVVDSLVAAAISAGLDPASSEGSDPVDADPSADVVTPVPLSRRRGGVPSWAVAAVVVVLVGLGLTLVWSGRDARDDGADQAFSEVGASITDDEASSAGADMSAESGLAEPGAATGPAEEANPATTTAPDVGTFDAPTLVNLGEFDDADALRVHLRDAFPTDDGENGPLPDTGVEDDLTAAFRCLGKVDGLFEPTGEPTGVGLALVAGDPTIVYDLPYRTDEGRDTTIVIAVDEVSCIPVLSFQR